MVLIIHIIVNYGFNNLYHNNLHYSNFIYFLIINLNKTKIKYIYLKHTLSYLSYKH